MKKKILLVICCLITVFLCACGQMQGCGRSEKEEITMDEQGSITEDSIAEDVEEVIESQISEEEPVQIKVLVKEIATDDDTVITTYYTYDEIGRVSTNKSTFAGQYVNEEYYTEWIYEDDGSYIENFYIVSDSNENKLSGESMYDENDNLLVVSDYSFRYCHELQYDQNGKVIGGIWYSLSGEGNDYSLWSYNKNMIDEYDYDDNEYLTEYRKVRLDGKISSKIEYTYNDNGQLINEEQFECWPDEYFYQGHNYQYDEEGKLIYTMRYNEDAQGAFQTIEEITYEYDADGDLVKESSIFYWNSGNSSEETITIYEYDYIIIEK